jgi:hypothetical protein
MLSVPHAGENGVGNIPNPKSRAIGFFENFVAAQNLARGQHGLTLTANA